MNDRLPPHNIEAEDAVIGSILLDSSVIHGLDLAPADFYHEPNRCCFAAAKALADKGTPVNQITLAQALHEQGRLDNIGGAAYLSRLIAECATPFDCHHYAAIVKRLATYRGLITAADKIADIGYAEGPDFAESINQADEALLALRKTGTSPIISPSERATLMANRYETLYTADAGVASPTGLTDLDAQIGGGLYAGELAIIAARPGMGKTTFLQQLANSTASTKSVLFCSGEMPMASLTDRDVAAVLGMTTNQVRRGGYSPEIYNRITGEALEAIAKRKVYIYHDSPLTTAKVAQAAVNMQLRYGLDLLVIDYLGLLADEYGNSQYERVGHISRKLKELALSLDTPVLVAHQLNRALEMRPDKRPQLSDLRDSGRVEEDADLVLFLYRDSYYQDEADEVTEILIAKQRQGESHQVVKVYYDRNSQQYRDLDERHGS